MCHFGLLIYRVLNNKLEKPVEGTAFSFNAFARNLFGGTEENPPKHGHESRCLGRDTNRSPSEFISDALLLGLASSVSFPFVISFFHLLSVLYLFFLYCLLASRFILNLLPPRASVVG
jgi:hypothetical protein